MNKKCFMYFVLLILSFNTIFAQNTVDIQKKRQDTIKYGMESEITSLLKIFLTEKDSSYNDELYSVFQKTKSTKLKELLIRFFTDMKYENIKKDIINCLENRDLYDNALILASISYCYTLKVQDSLPVAKVMFSENQKDFIVPIIKLLGAIGTPIDAKELISFFNNDVLDIVKEEIILALGNIGGDDAITFLLELADNTDEKKTFRMFALNALGKLKVENGLQVILDALDEQDALIREYAVSALSEFDTPESREGIMEALRDTNVKVRLAAAKGVAKLKLVEAVPNLIYRIANDPEKAMKDESFKTLALLDSKESLTYLQEYLLDKKNPLNYRELVFSLLFKNSIASSTLLFDELNRQTNEKDTTFLLYIAKEISLSDNTNYTRFAEILISSPQYLARICALEYIKKNRLSSFKNVIEKMIKDDPVDSVKKKAKEVFDLL